MKNDEIVTFRGFVEHEPFYQGNDDFKMYGMTVDTNIFQNIKKRKFGDVCVIGKIPSLSIGTVYEIRAKEKFNSKYGYSYEVLSLKGTTPKTKDQMKTFLENILTPNQVDSIWNAYPDFVERVLSEKLDDIDLSKMPGIGEVIFKKIVDRINETYKYAELLNEFNGLFSFTVIKKLYEKYTNPEMVRRKLKQNPYKFLTDLERIGFKKADSIILDFEKKGVLESDEGFVSSKQRCKAFIDYSILHNMDDGNTVITVKKLRELCVEEIPEAVSHFLECIKDDGYYHDEEFKYITFQSMYNKEKYVADTLIEALKDDYQIKNGFDVDKFKTSGDVELTDEQMNALHNLSEYNVSMLIGPGGTGKTFTTETIIKILEEYNKTYKLFAPTGRASKVLANYTHRQASTIHKGLEYNPAEGWGRNKDKKLECDFVIVDEFSMVDVSLFYHLVDAIDFTKTKLLIIGDAAQLSSVSAGNCLHDMMDSGVIPTTVLTKVFRYSEGGLMKVATDCRNRKPYLENITSKMTQFGDNKDYACIASSDEDILHNAIELYRKLINNGVNPEDILVTSAYNVGKFGINMINEKLQRIVNKNYGSSNCFEMKDVTYYVEDIVMQTTNNYRSVVYNMKDDKTDKDSILSIYNGEIGKVVKILKWGVVIKFDAGYVVYNNKELQTVQLGYACTTHKSQGSANDYVIIINPKAHTYMLTSNLIYVALTRTRKRCFQFCDPAVVNRAVKRKDEEERMTLLKMMLCSKKTE